MTLLVGGDTYQAGESLLNRGEPVLGFPLRSAASELEFDDQTEFDIGPLSPLLRHGHDDHQPPLTSSTSFRLSSGHPKGRRTFFSRQLSSPSNSRSSPFPTSSRSNLSSAASISPSGQSSVTLTDGITGQPRPVSEPVPCVDRDATLSDLTDEGNATILDIILDDQRAADLSRRLAERSRSLESQSTLTEPYFSADEGEDSDSITLRQYQSARTHLGTHTTGTGAASAAMSAVSDDTFKSLNSIALDPLSGDRDTRDHGVGSTGHLSLNRSRASLRSTFSAPPGNGVERETPTLAADSISLASTSSFMSAASSNRVGAGAGEDGINLVDTLVDLHNQMEMPIVDSPLLMSVYGQLLTKHADGKWSALKPPALNPGQRREKIRCAPNFKSMPDVDGFSALTLLPKKDVWEASFSGGDSKPAPSTGQPELITDEYAPGRVYKEIPEEEEDDCDVRKAAESGKRANTVPVDDGGDTVLVIDEEPSDDKANTDTSVIPFKRHVSKSFEYKSEKLTVLVKVNGDTTIKLTPLCLDGLKTLVDGLHGTLATVHPLSVINHLNLICAGRVEDMNVLKKQKMLHLGQLKVKAWRSTLDREKIASSVSGLVQAKQRLNDAIGPDRIKDFAQSVGGGHGVQSAANAESHGHNAAAHSHVQLPTVSGGGNHLPSGNSSNMVADASNLVVNQIDETRRSKVTLFMEIGKVTVLLLQTSLVEEVITFSALDQMNDLTCSSLLAVSLSTVNLSLRRDLKELRSLKTFIDSCPLRRAAAANSNQTTFAQFTQSKDLVSRLFSKKPKKLTTEVEPLTVETVTTLGSDFVATGKVSSLHGQLSRLRTSSSTILKEAVLTIIPPEQSKVGFRLCEGSGGQLTPASGTLNMPSPGRGVRRKSSATGRGILKRQEPVLASSAPPLKEWDDVYVEVTRPDTATTLCADTTMTSSSQVTGSSPIFQSGFIMFECGLERINLNVIKKNATDEAPPTDGVEEINSGVDVGNDIDERGTVTALAGPSRRGQTSAGLDVGAVWFNVAAPPKSPNTKKIDFTRLDWHFLSTATPSINAWLSTGDRLLVSVKKAGRCGETRRDAIMACLMSMALEVQGIHVAPPTKYLVRKRTPLAKTLQEDPSCQLLAVLRRYLKGHSSTMDDDLGQFLKADVLPSLGQLKRGVVALSRQWKNALYMPLLVEQNLRRDRDPASIPLRVLFGESSSGFRPQAGPVNSSLSPESPSDGYAGGSELETQSPLGGVVPTNSATGDDSEDRVKRYESPPDEQQAATSVGGVASVSGHKRRQSDQTAHVTLGARSSRASIAFPLLSAPLETIGSGVGKAYELSKGFLFSPNSNNSANAANGNVNAAGNGFSGIGALNKQRTESANSVKSTTSSATSDGAYQEEDLYNWMSRQQEYMAARAPLARRPSAPRNLTTEYDMQRYGTMASAQSFDDDLLATGSGGDDLVGTSKGKNVPASFNFLSTGVVADVQVIFEPLLKGLGIERIVEGACTTDVELAFEQLGPRVSLTATVRLFRVDIVESDAMTARDGLASPRSPVVPPPSPMPPSAGHATAPHLQVPNSSRISFLDAASGRFVPEANTESAAFICDKLVVEIDLRKVKDFDKDRKAAANNAASNSDANLNAAAAGHEAAHEPSLAKSSNDNEKVPIVIVGPDGGISQVTTVINFCVDVSKIVQRVNLPLLRLLHQFTSMVEAIKETRHEMKANRIETIREETAAKDRAASGVHLGAQGRKASGAAISRRTAASSEFDADRPSVPTTPGSSRRTSLAEGAATEGQRPHQLISASINFNDILSEDDQGSNITLVGEPLFDATTGNALVVPADHPKCWRTMFYLLDLYEITPETKTVKASERPPPLDTKVTIEVDKPSSGDLRTSKVTASGRYEQLNDVSIEMEDLGTPINASGGGHAVGSKVTETRARKSMINMVSSDQIKNYTQQLMHRELTPLVVFGLMKIKKVNLVANFCSALVSLILIN